MTDTRTTRNVRSVTDFESIPRVNSDATIALQPQYAHGRRFNGLARAVREVIDSTPDQEQLFQTIADPRTAAGIFLDWWGQRVGVSRYIRVNGEYTRFDDDYFRFLIFYRAACNVADATAETMNELLTRLTDTTVFVVDYLNMSINSIVIIGDISDLQSKILAQYGLLNRPAGVLTNMLVIYPDEQIFGFDGSELLPFDIGVFNPGREISVG